MASIFDRASGGDHCAGENISSLGHNLSDDSSCNLDTSSSDQEVSDLELDPLADNGGTKTHALSADSSARDVIQPNCDTLLDPSVDQRNEPRPSGNGCNAGAFE